MLEIRYDPNFLRTIEKIKDRAVKEKVKGQIARVIKNPEIGKPMRYARQGTREVYVAPYRLSYAYIKAQDRVILLDLYHKDEQ